MKLSSFDEMEEKERRSSLFMSSEIKFTTAFYQHSEEKKKQ